MGRYDTNIQPFTVAPTYAGLPVEAMGANLARQQKRYDITQDNINQYNAEIAQLQTRQADTPGRTDFINSLDEDLSNTIKNYNGDIGAARGDILGVISKYRQSPKLQAYKQALQSEQNAALDKRTYGADALDFNPDAWNQSVTFDKATGQANIPNYQIERRVKHRPIRESYFNQITADGGDINPTKAGEALKGYIKTGSWQGITDSKIRNYARKAYDDYKTTSSYDQAIREKLLNGVAKTKAEADKQVSKEFVSVGLERVYNRSNSRYMQDRTFDPNSGGGGGYDPEKDLYQNEISIYKTDKPKPDRTKALKSLTENDELANLEFTDLSYIGGGTNSYSTLGQEDLKKLYDATKYKPKTGGGGGVGFGGAGQTISKAESPYISTRNGRYEVVFGKEEALKKAHQNLLKTKTDEVNKATGSNFNEWAAEYPNIPKANLATVLMNRAEKSSFEVVNGKNLFAQYNNKNNRQLINNGLSISLGDIKSYDVKNGKASKVETNWDEFKEDINPNDTRVEYIPVGEDGKAYISMQGKTTKGKSGRSFHKLFPAESLLDETGKAISKDINNLNKHINTNQLNSEPFVINGNSYRMYKVLNNDGSITPELRNAVYNPRTGKYVSTQRYSTEYLQNLNNSLYNSLTKHYLQESK